MGSLVLLDLMGGVALLLWGLHMVHSGIVRAFGANLRRVLVVALRNRFRAFIAGVGVTALLQSSTAKSLMVTSFTAAAYPALEAAGELRDSRLKESSSDADTDRPPALGRTAEHSLR